MGMSDSLPLLLYQLLVSPVDCAMRSRTNVQKREIALSLAIFYGPFFASGEISAWETS